MFRLRRLYLDSVGVAENRFADLTVELTDMSGKPTDSIVWLRNGAGKTTMLSLLLALIRPGRRDFLATRTKNRTLEDLILSDDTAHVVAEWVGPDGELLVTGAVYEWDGRTRPTDYNTKGKDRLRRSWWCITPDSDVEGATLETLPFYLRTGGAYDRDRFCSHITGLAAQGVNAVVVNQTIGEWHAALRERRFDPGLFEYFLVVNAAEGGIDGLFADIDSPGKFVRYLLRFVGNHERIEPVRALLNDTASEIAKRPLYLAEKEFCDDAQEQVVALGVARANRADAARTLEEERQRAGQYKHALLEASAAAAELANQAGIRTGIINEALKLIRSDLDMYHSRAVHYRMKAAEFGVESAKAAVDRAEATATAAKTTVQAWQAVEQHLQLENRRAQLASVQAALEEKTQAARPLQDKVDEARAHLGGALHRELNRAEAEIAHLTAQIEAHNNALEAADAEVDAAQQRRTELDSERQTIHSVIDRFDLQKQRLIDRGVLTTDETLAAAEHRLTTAAAEARETATRLEQQQADTEHELESTAAQLDRDHEAVAAANLAHSQLDAQLQKLEKMAATLADNHRLRTLMQADIIELAHEAADAISVLEQAKAAAERELFELNEALAAGQRALHALKTDELLPPRLQVQKILDELAAAGITAVSGWKYLAQHIDVAQHTNIIAELPAVVDGIIVYREDLDEVAAHIHNSVEEVVVLAHVSVFDGRCAPQFILGPAPAQHDPAAATVELSARTEAHSQLDSRRDVVDRQRRTDDTLLSQLRAFADEIPPDGVDGLRSRVGSAAAALRAARDHEDATKQRRNNLGNELKELAAALQAQRTRAAKADADRPSVTDLAVTETEVIVPSRRRLPQIPAELATADAQLTRGKEKRAAAHAAKAERTLHKDQVTARRVDWRAELETLPDPQPTDLALQTARTAVEAAEKQLRERFPEATLRYAVQAAETEVRDARKQWDAHPEHVQVRALELVLSTDATDLSSRSAAQQRAAADAAQAERSRGEAETELRAAQRVYEEARRNVEGRRSRRDTDLVEPGDRAHAEQLAAEADAAESDLEEQRWRLEQELSADEAIQVAQNARAQLLSDQAAQLRKVDPVPAGADVTVSDDDDVVRAAVSGRLTDLDLADDMLATAERDFDACADALGLWASSDKFIQVVEDEHGHAVRRLREMLRDKASIKRVAENADTLVDDLGLRSKQIAEQLRQVDETKANIGSKMTEMVAEALTILRRAAALSELPEGVGEWDHHRFLDVAPRNNPTREQIALRIGDLIDTIVNARTTDQIRDPAELLWRATEAAVPEGFKATVLKPSPEQSTSRTPVADMRKWSGGENLTASLVLFCVLARLRAEQRTYDKATSGGGVLPLDNPVGKANYLPFLELQRKVARANGVQLLYWTGIGDLGAVTTFPRIAAMHKRPSTTRVGRAFVTMDADKSRQVLDIASAVRHEP
ncbi:hypothetical protein [Mycobacterium sp.]|uniref:hypothetical protein n=1 Tax=Mycobacterium sp. TaxID=1785 RepID=UPI003F9994C9